MKHVVRLLFICAAVCAALAGSAQDLQWTRNGEGFWQEGEGSLTAMRIADGKAFDSVTAKQLTPAGAAAPLIAYSFRFSADEQQLLIFTNTRKVWRYNTRGDYWVLQRRSGQLRQLGKGMPEASLMFAKISPDGTKAAYVSGHNLYVEDIATGRVTQLTKDGTRRLINGTFDWAYEEEFSCRDGFRWSPDSRSIAYWQIDATRIRDFLMINNTDSLYSFTVPVEYPKAGEDPSACKVGVVDVQTGKTTWMKVPGDARQHYIPRMEWVPGKNELIIQQLNRLQNTSVLMICDAASGAVRTIFTETDNTWVDVKSRWDDDIAGWDWLEGGKSFMWVSEKDGWRHLYNISTASGEEALLTPGDYDVIRVARIDEKQKRIYILASPDNATQQYLYQVPLSGGKPVRVSPAGQPGTHDYMVSPTAGYAYHSYQSHTVRPFSEFVRLPDHLPAGPNPDKPSAPVATNVSFFQVKTSEGVTLDGWMAKPDNFDSTKQYPVIFYVYGEPAACTVTDTYGAGRNFLYGNVSRDGYIYISLDNRGTPAPKGRAWRKAIYRKMGVVNATDQALAAKEILKWPFIDKDRVAVWGWSGGGSMTLNLLFRYPEIFKTGVAIAAVADLRTYDNIYQERYMGLPQENPQDYNMGSPIKFANRLEGKLLYIHGTGDDNVHYQNAELLVNALIRHHKLFQFMPYPNRTHSINEGENTSSHLAAVYQQFMRENCKPGPKEK
ncbi:S9 family peptidase [Chitinophaga lutea]